jgi:hypothetical protein
VTWLEYHTASQSLAEAGAESLRTGEPIVAAAKYRDAAALEEKALRDLDRTRNRTLGITAVSAIAMFVKGRAFQEGERLAFEVMNWPEIPSFAGQQIRELLSAIWSEKARSSADTKFLPGQVMVSVRGGQVVTGGAPLDLIVEKVQTIRAMFVRTTEMLLSKPHRARGNATSDIRDMCRPWLFQTAPGSYQFAVAIEEASQMDMFGNNQPRAQDIAREFLRILSAATVDPEHDLPKVVENQEYRATFLKLARNLSPASKGRAFDSLEIRFPDDLHGVELSGQTRELIQGVLRSQREAVPPNVDVETVVLEGILRAVHLDRDWLEIAIGDSHIRIAGVRATYDDLVGPLVNRPVAVRASKDSTGAYHFVDIEPAE